VFEEADDAVSDFVAHGSLGDIAAAKDMVFESVHVLAVFPRDNVFLRPQLQSQLPFEIYFEVLVLLAM